MLDALHYQQGRGSYLHKVITFLSLWLDGGGQRCCLFLTAVQHMQFLAAAHAVLPSGVCFFALNARTHRHFSQEHAPLPVNECLRLGVYLPT